jgi:N4-gp56 family major capsid protein
MADWTYETGNNLTRKAWEKKWWIEAKTEAYFYENGFVGSNYQNSIIVELSDLEKAQGDQVTIGQIRELNGSGVSGDSIMEGNEEAPDTFDDAIVLDQERNAVRLNGAMSEQRAADGGLRGWAVQLLKRWMADKIDQDLFTALGSSFTKSIYGGDATTTATIEAGDYMTLSLISKCVAYAKKATPKITGINQKGKMMWVIVVAIDQAYDLRERDAAWSQAQREAMKRGEDNNLFKDAEGMWNGTVIHCHERVPISTTWGSGSNLNGASAFFMGAGAGSIAYAKRRIYNEKTFDYKNMVGFCVGSIYGVTKNVFNSADNAIVGVRTYRTSN